MSELKSPKFEKRQVQEWLELAEKGTIALPEFQRSYVWKSGEPVAHYLAAIFMNRPTGVFLVLKTNGSPQFPSRTLRGIDHIDQAQTAEELLLDGQQRLTSLVHAFHGEAPVAYYVHVQDLRNNNVGVLGVEFCSKASAKGKAMQDPRKAYDANWVPVHILQDRVVNADDDTEISEWSIRAVNDAKRARRLEKAINRLREQVLLRRDLHYCELDAQTERDTAIDIFVQSNKSSVKVNEFDIAVALASQTGDENLRERITEFHRHSDVMRQYFTEGDDDEERVLAKLGEWLLFSACLTVKKLAPKRRHFEDIVRHLSQLTKAKANEDLNQLLKNLETALHTLGDHGSPTEDTLPARPPLHVIAGLQDVLLTVTGANRQGVCNKVISAYLWRAFLTERYETKANDRLFEDYEGLLVWIREVNDTGRLSYDRSPPIFDKKEYPLPDATTLGVDRDVPWIKGRRRLGRAIASLTLFCGARDWVTGNDLHARNVRGLVERRKLERHHVFPRAVLRKHGFPNDMVNHGLNGVLLSQQANQTLSKKDPADYMKAVLQQQGATLTEKDLRDRVESHLVPYDVIISGDSLERRFETFITERARIFARKIEAVANLSQG